MVTHLLTTAVRLVFLGVVGEYAGRTYLSVCHKPQTAVREVLGMAPSPEVVGGSALDGYMVRDERLRLGA
jgi:hypothetical protein